MYKNAFIFVSLYQNDRTCFLSYLCISKIHRGRKGRALILTYIHDRTILEVKIRYIVHTGHDITFVHQCTYLVYIVLKTSRNSQMTLCNSHQVTRIWWWENDTDTHCAVQCTPCSYIHKRTNFLPMYLCNAWGNSTFWLEIGAVYTLSTDWSIKILRQIFKSHF